jgi:DNA-binding HxlR family transcriptional regulator
MTPNMALVIHSRRSAEADAAGRPEHASIRGNSPQHARSPIETTLDLITGRWKALIVWHLFWGPRPFCDLMRSTDGITKKTLRHELAEMERYGLITREVRFKANRKVEYRLTPFGDTLKPVVATMYEWGLYAMKNKRSLASDAGYRAT